MIKQIETPNLILRKAKKEDLEDIYNNVWKDEELTKNMFWETSKSLEEAKDRLDRTIKYHQENDAFFVTLKETGEVIGFAGVNQKDIGVYEDSGVCICQKQQQKGYGKELLRGLEKLVFDGYKGQRMYYSCFYNNEASRKVCMSQGFNFYMSVPKIRPRDDYRVQVDYYYLDADDYVKEDNIILSEGD